MKIVFLSVWFSDRMGYIENCLPKALAKLGNEVHVISSTAQVYYNEPNYDAIYKPYLGDRIQAEGSSSVDGFTLHRLPFGTIQGKIYIKKLGKKIKEIDPDVVQSLDAFSFLSFQGTYYKLFHGYKYFTANHIVASVFPLYQASSIAKRFSFWVTRTIPGRAIALLTSRCYPATIDALHIAVNYYGVPLKKAKLAPLGVDTDIFSPNRIGCMKKEDFGIDSTDILCIYTGRFTEGKNPLLLAKAVEKLVADNQPFKALFVGDGPQKDEIKDCNGCFVHDFVPYHELPDFYYMADIGVWPRQESTSMLDATSCGLPIVISDKVQATERVDGNGLTYAENDVDDLVKSLMKLKDAEFRTLLSKHGIDKIMNNYSWLSIAQERMKDYDQFVK